MRLRVTLCSLLGALVLFAGPSANARAANVSGRIVGLTATTLTLQTSGPQSGLLDRLIAGADAVTREDLPYVWGGGHAAAGYPSLGSPGPGFTGHTVGYDCSGAVAAVLAAGGLWPRGASVPADYGVIGSLAARGLIAPGVGRGVNEVNFYDFPDVHIFMSIDGAFFGTSDGGYGGDPAGGPGWLDDLALFLPEFGGWDAVNPSFHAYHLRAGLLAGGASDARRYTFLLSGPRVAAAAALEAGETVQVAYRENGAGALVAGGITLTGTALTDGTLTAIGADSISLRTAGGAPETFSLGPQTWLGSGLRAGAKVQVTSVTVRGVRVAYAVVVASTTSSPYAVPGA